MNSWLPVNYSIEFKAFIHKNDFSVLCIVTPGAPIPYHHADGTLWMKADEVELMWPFETVIKNLPEIEYR